MDETEQPLAGRAYARRSYVGQCSAFDYNVDTIAGRWCAHIDVLKSETKAKAVPAKSVGILHCNASAFGARPRQEVADLRTEKLE